MPLLFGLVDCNKFSGRTAFHWEEMRLGIVGFEKS